MFWWAVIKWSFAMLLILAAAVYAYQSASVLAERKVQALESEIEQLTADVAALQESNLVLERAAGDARFTAEQWEARYSRDVPTGTLAELLDQVERELEEGAEVERLSFLIASADRQPACDPGVDVRRFLVRTPLSPSGNDSVAFGEGAITVTAIGESEANAQGNLEAWYDPNGDVTVVFTALGGQASQVQGILPLHHAVVFNDSEYRFTLAAGQRGFLQVAGQRCDYP